MCRATQVPQALPPARAACAAGTHHRGRGGWWSGARGPRLPSRERTPCIVRN